MHNKCTILIVEDELITRQALKYIIGKEGRKYDVIGEASNGQEALGLIQKEKPDIVISDIVMPVMDGVEFTKYVKLKYPEICVIILSSHSDFDYVKSTFKYGVFEYILKPKLEPDSLLETLNKAAKYLGIAMRDSEGTQGARTDKGLFEEIIVDPEKSWEREEVELYYKSPYFYLIGCDLTKIEGYRGSKERVYFEMVYDKMKQFATEKSEVVLTKDKKLLMLINTSLQAKEKLVADVNKMSTELLHDMPSIQFVISEMFDDFYELKNMLIRIDYLLDLQFYMQKDLVIVGWRVDRTNGKVNFDSKSFRKKLGIGIYEDALDMIEEFIDKVDYKSGLSGQELKKILENSFYNVYSELEEDQKFAECISDGKMQMFKKINNVKNYIELRLCTKVIVEELKEMISHCKSSNQIITQIYQYINENYKDPITLKDVAVYFHMSYSYLSSYFSSISHKGFNEYLNEVRMDKAKEMLANSDASLSKIGVMVGYTDQSYFSRVFKKVEGCSPSSYRRKCKGGMG